MSGRIYLRQPDGSLRAMEESGFSSEDVLQRLLADYPDLLAGEQVDPEAPRRWLLVTREFGVPDADGAAERWSLDHLFLDQDGIPTLVEVKRSSDTRLRREVVGQMLDYAANAVVYWPIETVRARLETTCTVTGTDPVEAVCRLLDRPETDEAAVAEFLNGQMDPAEVLAVEIRQYVGGEMQTLVPRVLGQTATAQQRKGTPARPTRSWDEDSFFSELESRCGSEATAAARALYEWAKAVFPHVEWGSGARFGSLIPYVRVAEGYAVPFTVNTSGTVKITFEYLKNKPFFREVENRRELLRRLNTIPGFGLPDDGIERRPSISLRDLVDPAKREAFQEVMSWVRARLEA